jgi:hypothetical protein
MKHNIFPLDRVRHWLNMEAGLARLAKKSRPMMHLDALQVNLLTQFHPMFTLNEFHDISFVYL